MTKFTIRLNEETAEKLEDLIKKKYKGRGDKTSCIRWLIEDCWEEENKDKVVKVPSMGNNKCPSSCASNFGGVCDC